MPYRLLLPSTVDLAPADVHEALAPFRAQAMADRGLAWQLAADASWDAAPIIVRLLPAKGIARHENEPRFRIPKDTRRAVEVITPGDTPSAAACQAVHECATALADALKLGVLNPYRGVYSRSATEYCEGLTDPPAMDAIRVRTLSRQTQRRQTHRTRPAGAPHVRKADRKARTHAGATYDAPQGMLGRWLARRRGVKHYQMTLPVHTRKEDVKRIVGALRRAVPMAEVTVDRRAHAVRVSAPDTPLVGRTVREVLDRQSRSGPRRPRLRTAPA